ncbi:glycerophosphodiester phosphodiesterase family protein [Roseivivax sediminis]|uniref:glycerophosphodiester phosphodiesterase n=1 Tax=Roseivivax sediminis TaxID=936889 RepID=A0A1I2CCT5_9RHOB|nr:glycerophosphodiester phosphodiesterase family protein [Roseivivax sediminis]SFE66064.1 glycerophosphoryl diester phosphodiesterase [Roseivivax sediminis]
MTRAFLLGSALLALPVSSFAQSEGGDAQALSYGPRPFYLIDKMADSELKSELMSCRGQEPQTTKFSIGHRGAPLMFPEHTVESNRAAAVQGAGILECDVTFTSDEQLVCRHAQNDLHTTTNIVTTDLAETCTTPFTPATEGEDATAECRTSEITLEEFRTLEPKMDAADASATTAEEYVGGTADWRTDLYANGATLMTHAESIALFDELGADFTPELKSPSVEMPMGEFTQEAYAQKMIDEYQDAGIDPSRVWPQSFNLEDVLYWIENEPEFGEQAVFLVEWTEGFDEQDPETWQEDFASLAEQGVNYLAPSLNMLMTVGEDDAITASDYAMAAKEAGLELITWTLERSGPLHEGGGWYYESVNDVIDTDGDYFEVLDVMAQEVGVVGVFSDWPATVTYYANCKGL